MTQTSETIDILAGQIEALANERNRVVSLLAGVLEGCEGCTTDAVAFVTAFGSEHSGEEE